VKRYCELTAAVREKLAAAGEDQAAEGLLRADRGGSTSGEVISNVAVVLRRLDGVHRNACEPPGAPRVVASPATLPSGLIATPRLSVPQLQLNGGSTFR
jgi:hypothetical protein